MKVIFAIVLIMTTMVNFVDHSSKAKGLKEEAALIENLSRLRVSIVAQKRRYKRNDQLKFDVMLTNSGKDAVYIFGQLDWGISASFDLRVHDASGKEVQPVGRFDDLTVVSTSDKSAFVKLLPSHFLGTDFFAPLEVLNINKPGKYAVFVEYHSPFAGTDVPLSPFWGKENGTIRSNILDVEVVH